MRKRKLEIRVVKEEPKQQPVATTSENLNIAELAAFTFSQTIKTIGIAAVGYIILDTARQVIIAKAGTPK